ncbi:MAG TPA: amino acid permease [Steroidobacteraceae bacterium]|nr:amino acid permease [Steroidobacteraceae bacterium]
MTKPDPGGAPSQAHTGLRRGTLGPVLLSALGVSYVIAGDYAGWNLGLASGGWGGLLLAVIAAAGMFFALILSIAELAAMMPGAGGGYDFAREAFGPALALVAGLAILVEYGAAASVVAIFVGAYFEALSGVPALYTMPILYCLVAAIHAAGVGEAMRVLLVLAGIAALGLLLYLAGVYAHFDPAKLADVPAISAAGASKWLPGGWRGVWISFPFGTAFFLAVEGIPMAAEEARDPARTVPRAMMAAMAVLAFFAVSLVIFGPGAAGAAALAGANDPLIVGLLAAGHDGGLLKAVNVCGLVGLGACFFAAMFAYSRQAFALARAGHLPALLARTNARRSPVPALLAVGLGSYLLAVLASSAAVYVVMVTAASLSYLIMLAAHLALRRRQPARERPYRTPGGVITGGFAWVMSSLCMIGCFAADWTYAGATTLAIGITGVALVLRKNIGESRSKIQ